MGFFKKEKKEVVDVQPFSTPYESKTNESRDGLTRAMDNAADVATMRHVMLQFYNWFKSDFKEMPLFERDALADDTCNCFAQLISDYMIDITKEKNKNKV